MARTLACKSCGAENDVIFERCIYCGSTLDNNDLEVVSNEDLVSNAASWIEKIHEERVRLSSTNSNGNIVRTALGNGEIKAYAKKYLSILQYRALRYPELNQVCDGLSKRFTEVSKKYRNMWIYFVGGFSLFWAILLFLVILPSEKSDAKNAEALRINKVAEEVSALIDKNEYQTALIKIDQITWQYEPDRFQEEAKQTDKQRENLRETIMLLMKGERSHPNTE
ncbi:MAG: hypothetical protein PHQ41_01600 [Candidatus Cloacimonetes bacterium]|nr:hypothetical protein [Candidatus Cloacimonadota bacterium]